MKNKTLTLLENKAVNHTEGLSLSIFVILLVLLAFYAYFLFNRPPDPIVKSDIKNEIESINIKFNTKTINDVLNLKSYEKPLDTNTLGKNPFITY